MSRDLLYIQITQAQARTLDFQLVMEDSWDTARWDNNQTMCMIHFVSPPSRDISNWMREQRIPIKAITTHAVENAYIRTGRGRTSWDNPARPPRE